MGPLADASTTPYVFLLLMIGVIGWLMFRITRRINQKESLQRTPRITNTVRSLGTAPPPEFDRWSVEMQDLARDTLAQIDTKMRALDYLTREANAAATRLETALAEANTAHQSVDTAVSHATPESLTAHNQADVLERATGRTHHEGATSTTDSEPRRRRIYELADRGIDVSAIATEVGSPTGEVELILGLRRQRG